MTGSFLESKRGDRCHFEEIKYVFPISNLSDVSLDPFHEPTRKRKVQHRLWERRACQWLYQFLAYRTSFSFTSKVVTLDGAHTLDLRPAFSFPGPAHTRFILWRYRMTQKSRSDISQNDKVWSGISRPLKRPCCMKTTSIWALPLFPACSTLFLFNEAFKDIQRCKG